MLGIVMTVGDWVKTSDYFHIRNNYCSRIKPISSICIRKLVAFLQERRRKKKQTVKYRL